MIASEIIGCESYYDLCDYHYMDQDDLPSGVIHCDIGAIPNFFRKIHNNGNKYIVVSSRSDYTLCYQKQFPVHADWYKAIRMAENQWDQYTDIKLECRCDRTKCNINDKYSIKCYMWTLATFNYIPDNVEHWFLTNCTIHHPKITNIPMGIMHSEGNRLWIDKIAQHKQNLPRDKMLYVNFQFCTYERLELYEYFDTICKSDPSITVERNKDFDTYLDQLNRHKYCLCPIGNGIDCYRTLEALYMGCIPVIEAHPGTMFLAQTKLPILFTLHMLNINSQLLHHLYKPPSTDYDELKLSYWRNKIVDKRREHKI